MITKRMNIKQTSQLILRFKIMPSPCNEILVLKNYLHHAHFSFRTWRACAYITYSWITIRVRVFSRYFTHTHLAYFKTGLVIYAVFLSLTRGQFLQKIQYGETSWKSSGLRGYIFLVIYKFILPHFFYDRFLQL